MTGKARAVARSARLLLKIAEKLSPRVHRQVWLLMGKSRRRDANGLVHQQAHIIGKVAADTQGSYLEFPVVELPAGRVVVAVVAAHSDVTRLQGLD